MTYKVLLDLSEAIHGGYCGIAQDNRLTFKMLAENPALIVAGLLTAQGIENTAQHYQATGNRTEQIIQNNQFLHTILNSIIASNSRSLQYKNIKPYLSLLTKTQFNLFALDKIFNPVIWRNFLNKSLSQADKFYTQQAFYFSDLCNTHLVFNTDFIKRNIYLNTQGYDFAIFANLQTSRVAKETIKIMRYHDNIPITDPDTVASSRVSNRHLNAIRHCQSSDIVVCDSHATAQGLIDLFPNLAKRTFTIPCVLSSHYQPSLNNSALLSIIKNRLSLAHNNDKDCFFNDAQNLTYLLSVATLEPRKNYLTLIQAWEKFNFNQTTKIKLMIVANRGWKSGDIERAMLPHIRQGNLIHLEKLTSDELPYVYSHAKAFIFPSYNEGFGYPPLEAMQCACPVIVSDIPVHREIMGDAAYYCDPYDSNDIAQAINSVMSSAEISTALVAKGKQHIKHYTSEQIMPQWLALFERLKSAQQF